MPCSRRRSRAVYFNLPSKIGPRGPSKTLTFNTREKQPVFVSIFPDREAKNLDFTLQLNFKDAAGKKRTLKIPCHVIDQDKLPGDDATTSTFPIDVDFSRDRTGFFDDEKKRRVVQQAVHDWAYFLAPVARDPVRLGAEKTFVWDPDGFKHGHDVTNAQEYSGYLLYAYGIHGPEVRSGGEASLHGGFQRENGKDQAVRRSGGYEAETRGNYNTLGWLIGAAGGDYWKATNLRKVPNDLLSIAHHEIGHALFFSSGNTRFAEAQRRPARRRRGPRLSRRRSENRQVGSFRRFDRSGEPLRCVRQRVPRRRSLHAMADHQARSALRKRSATSSARPRPLCG